MFVFVQFVFYDSYSPLQRRRDSPIAEKT